MSVNTRFNICTKCGINKTINEFNKDSSRNSGYRLVCKDCRKPMHQKSFQKRYKQNPNKFKKYVHQQYIKKRKFLYNFKNNSCTDCGKKFLPEIMEFDHIIERDKKKFNLSQFNSKSKKDILLEIKKCEIVCACCHSYRTIKRNGGLCQ